MTKAHAIFIFKSSKPLAWSLLNSTLQSSLYPNEGEILIGLQKIVDAGLANMPEIYKIAGLNEVEYNALLARLAYHHARGDDRADLAPELLVLNN